MDGPMLVPLFGDRMLKYYVVTDLESLLGGGRPMLTKTFCVQESLVHVFG